MLAMFVFLIFNNIHAFAADDNVYNLGTRIINDTNKTWTITFAEAVDFSTIPDNVQIKDVTTGNYVTINPVQGDSKTVVKVAAPSGGYIVGHNYQISLNKNIKFANNTFLSRATVLDFIVISKTSDYSISAKVTVSPVISAFKQITVTSTNLPGAAKYKVDGNNNLFDIGKPMVLVSAENSVKVYICDSLGSVLGTASMDVSITNSSMTLNLQ